VTSVFPVIKHASGMKCKLIIFLQVRDMLHEGALLPVATLVPPQPFDTMLGPAPLICLPENAGQSSACLGLPMSQQLESTLCPMQSE